MSSSPIYQSKHKIRIVTSTSLFDGHDASINVMRRILQASGAEVIHLGHNRSAKEIVDCAIQEDVQAIAITSYQGGHIEFFKYMFDLLKEKHCGHIRIFGGGGGTILPSEIVELHSYGITRIYSPDDGRAMGLQGMINDLLEKSDFANGHIGDTKDYPLDKEILLGKAISLLDNSLEIPFDLKNKLHLKENSTTPVIGLTGTGGAGKSSITDELIRRFINDFPEKQIAIISIDPSKKKTGGALLGDRIRMNSIHHPNIFMRSLATREANLSVNKHISEIVKLVRNSYFDLIFIETAGIGQSDSMITEIADISIYAMTPEFGAATQLEKIDMLDFADLVVINKFDRFGAEDALRSVAKQYQRNHKRFDEKIESMPVYGTIASQFNDAGMNRFYLAVLEKIEEKLKQTFLSKTFSETKTKPDTKNFSLSIVPQTRTRYLSEIAKEVADYKEFTQEQSEIASKMYQLRGSIELLYPEIKSKTPSNDLSFHKHISIETNEFVSFGIGELLKLYQSLEAKLHPECKSILENWESKTSNYKSEYFTYKVRDKEIKVANFTKSLSELDIPKISLPRFKDWGDILRWNLQENVPGEFPFTAGVYPFKRSEEDPTRMFAGEGGPERTNKRFHYITKGQNTIRLSTAFDSVTLYGENPDKRMDIYGKIGNSGVSIASLDDIKKLYSGFDLCKPSASVSMTINGPAPMLLAFFMNAIIDQQCEIYIRENALVEEVEKKIQTIYEKNSESRPRYAGDLPEHHNGLGLLLLGVTGDQVLPKEIYEKIKADAMSKVRGTVQADILKEDQAQNTCIFSTEFALKLMGDIQEYFIHNKVRNFYSVSISGYHIAEAGANPITQLALTLSNGFTYIEYYLSRGMKIDDFAPNLSFFFSNGMDPEYSVMGRVARRVWAKAIKYKYKGSLRSQLLKYHIQTSGRSLHAQEIEFNDIRTTLQALTALYDNCNSLHTNAFDEAITTPTEDSVRRAMAIQLIINREMGLAKNENPLQGCFIIEELTDLVEERVMLEFIRISERGGVLGAMETMYQRNKIQDESLHYEHLKHSGEFPIIGVNTFLNSKGSPTIIPEEVIRSTKEERDLQITNIENLHKAKSSISNEKILSLKKSAIQNENLFERLMDVSKYLSLGQMTQALYEVGGQYRRNM
ncbi:MAG: methylmalonyl-CoA mutase family protein [Leptospiraceae bacterium]|nr:methylmalonyl-CoA mutase family protein [Leptospiraceae bacterium]